MREPLNANRPVDWQQRFRCQKILSAQIAAANPQRGLVCTNLSSVYQLYGWDISDNSLHPITHHLQGKSRGRIAVNGQFIYYLEDQKGNEIGHYVRVPFAGGEAQDITPDLPLYSSTSSGENRAGSVLGLVTASGGEFQVYLIDQGKDDTLTSPRLLWRSPHPCARPTFSYNGDRVILATSERTKTRAFSLIVWDTVSGELVNQLYDENASIYPVCYAPQAGDLRALVISDRTGFNRPLLWHSDSGEQQALALDEIQGDLYVWDWSVEGDRLLLCELHQACHRLYLYDLTSHDLHPLHTASGTFEQGEFLPNGEILLNFDNAAQPSHLIALNPETQAVRTVLAAGNVPPSQPWQSVTFASLDGTEIQAWLALPKGEGPFPTILHAHGGPSSVATEMFVPSCQDWLDQGFAWLSVNYRGSVTFGQAFERAIWGQLGVLEVEDLVAARHWLVDQGMAQANAIFLTGGSYGGYLTLQTLGKYPDLWAGGMAEVAIADWVLMYEDQAETMRGAQRSFFGGTPQEKPEAHRVASPITYAEQVSAPILVIQGQNDTRCPARQMQTYEAKLKSLGKVIEVHWFDAGHGTRDNEQSIQHQEIKLRFAQDVLQRL